MNHGHQSGAPLLALRTSENTRRPQLPTHPFTQTDTRTHAHTHTHARTHAHAHTHTPITHTHTHTHTQTTHTHTTTHNPPPTPPNLLTSLFFLLEWMQVGRTCEVVTGGWMPCTKMKLLWETWKKNWEWVNGRMHCNDGRMLTWINAPQCGGGEGRGGRGGRGGNNNNKNNSRPEFLPATNNTQVCRWVPVMRNKRSWHEDKSEKEPCSSEGRNQLVASWTLSPGRTSINTQKGSEERWSGSDNARHVHIFRVISRST